MTTLAITDVDGNTSRLSRPLRDNEEVTLTFHGKPLAQAVPVAKLQQERAELARLRELQAEHARLRELLAEHGIAA